MMYVNSEGQTVKVIFCPSLLTGDTMKYPCNDCLVVACCTEVCKNIAKFWTIIYKEYKISPEPTIVKYNLDEKHCRTLKDLYDSAGHRPVKFKVFGNNIHVTIEFSIEDTSKFNIESIPHDTK